jgi:hypothetical protein
LGDESNRIANADWGARHGVLRCRSAETSDRAVVLVLLQMQSLVTVLDANRNRQLLGRSPCVLGKCLGRLRDEMLVKITQRRAMTEP